jgi:hypothetical protein
MFLLLGVGLPLAAQHPALAPTVDTTIVVTGGVLHYSTIHVPAGVSVRFEAPGWGSQSTPGIPAIVVCDGDAIVHGSLSVSTAPFGSGQGWPAGWVTTGVGSWGYSCPSGGWITPPGGGRHDVGSVLPFSLEGGSAGGVHFVYGGWNCSQVQLWAPGGEGGGTLALLAGGRIEVHGTVTAEGVGLAGSIRAGGSGGSILLRGHGGVQVFPGGRVTARGGASSVLPAPLPPYFSFGEDGKVRLDAWGAAPIVQGTVEPAPTLVELPYLHAPTPPMLGTTWSLQLFAPDAGWVYVAASLGPGNVATPFGLVGIDLASSAAIEVGTPAASHDPFLAVQWPIPNTPSLIGFAMWLQGIAVPPSLAPRVSNTIAVVVQ